MRYRKAVLMYHSVCSDEVPAVRGSFAITLERFRLQVREAKRLGWRFGRISELRDPVDCDTLYITGDDGTVDWARTVLPWCEEQGIPTHTAIITGPWKNEPIWPVAHRVQILLTFDEHDLSHRAEAILSAEQRAYIDKVYNYELEPRRRYLKGACNVVLTDAQAREFLGEPRDEELELLEQRFAPPDEYGHFRYAELGAHTVSHRAFCGNAERYAAEEIDPCMCAIRDAGLQPTNCFTLPVRPRFPATVEQLVPAARRRGFEAILDGAGEWDGVHYLVPRITAKEVEDFLARGREQSDRDIARPLAGAAEEVVA